MKILLMVLAAAFAFTCLAHFASAHTVNPLTIQYDTSHTQPPARPILTKYGDLLFVIPRNSTFTIPITIGGDNFKTPVSLSLYASFRGDRQEYTSKGLEVSLVPDHLVLNGSVEHKVDLIVKVSSTATDGLYKTFIETGFGGWQSIAYLVEGSTSHVPSPLKQFESGVPPFQIRCGYPLVLFFRSSDHYPVCLTIATEEKLRQRHWLDMGTGPYIDRSSVPEHAGAARCTSAQSQYAVAGPMGSPLCPEIRIPASAYIVNTTGFSRVYTYDKIPSVKDYVLEPGHNATIAYTISIGGPLHPAASVPGYPNHVKIPNNVDFMHDAGMHDHPGVSVTANPPVHVYGTGESGYVIFTFSASRSAPPGSYWVTLPPGTCAGGQLLVLTVANCTEER